MDIKARNILIGILLLGLLLRVYRLGYNDLWYDEAITTLCAQGVDSIYGDAHAPLYTFIVSVLLHMNKKIGIEIKEPEFIVRFPAMVFGVLCIYVLYKVATILFSPRVGIISAFFLSISPFHIWYSQEARGYTLGTFFAICIIWLFLKLLKNENIFLWLGFVIFSILGFYVSYFVILLMLPEFLIIIVLKRKELVKKLLIAHIVSTLFFLPWLILAFNGRLGEVIKGNFWSFPPNFVTLIHTWDIYNLGYNGYFIQYMILKMVTFLLVIYYLQKVNGKDIVFSISLFVLPIILVFFLSQWRPIFLIRKMILFSPFYISFIAACICNIKRTIWRWIIICIFIIFWSDSLFNYFNNYTPTNISYFTGTYVKKPIEPIVKYIKRYSNDEDIICLTSPDLDPPFSFYWGNLHNVYYLYIPDACDYYWGRLINSQSNTNTKVINLKTESLIHRGSKAWVIFSSWERDGRLDSNSAAVKEWLESRFFKIDEKEFEGIIVSLFKINE